jgi:hypothetical protein
MSSEKSRKITPFDLFQKYIPFTPPNRASDEDAAARLAICEGCPQLRKKTDRHGLKSTCKECNCFMPEKVKLASAVCPLGKWTEVLAN